MENKEFILMEVYTFSGKLLGYEVRKRVLNYNEYGRDKWSFTDKNDADVFMEGSERKW